MALGRVLRQHGAEGVPLGGLPHAQHLAVQVLEEGAPQLERVLGRQPVLREAVAQGPAGEEGDRAVVMVLDRPAEGPAQAGRVVEVMRHAQRRHADHLEMLVGIHVAQRHQGAVLGVQRGGVVGQGLDTQVVGHPGQQLAERRVARRLERHVGDEVRQLVAGVGALEVRRAVDVVVGIDQPVGVEHHQRVHAECTAAAADLGMPVDRVLPRAVARAGQLAQVHRRHMGDLGGECELAHGAILLQTPQCGMWCEPIDTAMFFGSRNTS